jgi:hypothetical protein
MAHMRVGRSSRIFIFLDYLKGDKVIIGGDLKFTLIKVWVWEVFARVDCMTYFFRHKIKEVGLVDLESVKLMPT